MEPLPLDPKQQPRESCWRAALHDTRGVTSLEYALIAGTIFAVIILGAGQVGGATGALFDFIARMTGR